MKKFGKVTALAIAVLTLGACGADDTAPAADSGSLSVTISGIEALADGVASINVEISKVGGGYLLEEELTSAPWSLTVEKLEFGTYIVNAAALDEHENVLFETAAGTEVLVEEGGHPVVQIILYQKDQSSTDMLPQFLTVTLDKNAVYLNETLNIAVTAAGGIGELSLHGRFWSGACNLEDRTTDSWGNWECINARPEFGSFGAADGMNLTWTAPSVLPPVNPTTGVTDIWLVLVIEDTAQNIAELGVTVPVRPTYLDSTEFQMAFQMAPIVNYRARVLNDGDAGSVYLRFTPVSDGAVAMDYELVSTCPYTKRSGAEESGTTASGAHVTFTLEVLGEDRGACDMTFSVQDTTGLRTTKTLYMNTAEIEPVVVEK